MGDWLYSVILSSTVESTVLDNITIYSCIIYSCTILYSNAKLVIPVLRSGSASSRVWKVPIDVDVIPRWYQYYLDTNRAMKVSPFDSAYHNLAFNDIKTPCMVILSWINPISIIKQNMLWFLPLLPRHPNRTYLIVGHFNHGPWI